MHVRKLTNQWLLTLLNLVNCSQLQLHKVPLLREDVLRFIET